MKTAMIRTDSETVARLRAIAPAGNVSRFLREFVRKEDEKSAIDQAFAILDEKLDTLLAQYRTLPGGVQTGPDNTPLDKPSEEFLKTHSLDLDAIAERFGEGD